MTRSRLLASLLAAALLAYLVLVGAIGLGYKALTIPGMVVFGWTCVFFGDELAHFLNLPESSNPTVIRLQNHFIQGLGWLSLGVVAGLVALKLLHS